MEEQPTQPQSQEPAQKIAADSAAVTSDMPQTQEQKDSVISSWDRRLKHIIQTFSPWLIGITVLIVGILVVSSIRGGFITTTTDIAPTPTPSRGPTPTPIRAFSIIATQSAFLELEQALATLSGDLQEFTVQDPALSPPELTLPLGFSRL